MGMNAIVGSPRPQWIDLLTQVAGGADVRAGATEADPISQFLDSSSLTPNPLLTPLPSGISSEELVQQLLLTSLRGLLDELDEVLISPNEPTESQHGNSTPSSGAHKTPPDSGLNNAQGRSPGEATAQKQDSTFTTEGNHADGTPTARTFLLFSFSAPETHQSESPLRVANSSGAPPQSQIVKAFPPNQEHNLPTPTKDIPEGLPNNINSRVLQVQGALSALQGATTQKPNLPISPLVPPPSATELFFSKGSEQAIKLTPETARISPPTFKNIVDLQRLELVRDLLKTLISAGAESDTGIDNGIVKALLRQLPDDLMRDLAQRSAPASTARTPDDPKINNIVSPEKPSRSDEARVTPPRSAAPFIAGTTALPAQTDTPIREARVPLTGPFFAAVRDMTSPLRSNLTIALDPALLRALHNAALSRPYRRSRARKYADRRLTEGSRELFPRDDTHNTPHENHDTDLHESTGLAWLRAFLAERDHAPRT